MCNKTIHARCACFFLAFLFGYSVSAQQWSELGGNTLFPRDTPINSFNNLGTIIYSVYSANGNIYAAGSFSNDSLKNYVAEWNNGHWSELGGTDALAANANIFSICSDLQGNIYTAGSFTTSQNHDPYVAEWSGGEWSGVGQYSFSGNFSWYVNNSILSICSDLSGNIYTAGSFTAPTGGSGTSGSLVLEWNGSTWGEAGSTGGLYGWANNTICRICSDPSGNIYAAGKFTNGQTPSSGSRYVAELNNDGWSELGGVNALAANADIYSICSDGSGNIYAAGAFQNGSGYRYVAKWNGTHWSELGGTNSQKFNSSIYTICSDASGNIYAAGQFTNDSGKYYVAKWNDTTWSELGGINALAANNAIWSICSDPSGNIYAAGAFTDSSIGIGSSVIGWPYVAKYGNITDGIKTIQGHGDISLYPNPSIGLFKIQFSDNQLRYISIYDIAGRCMVSAIPVTGNKDFDISGLCSGTYLLQVSDAGYTSTYKLIKQD